MKHNQIFKFFIIILFILALSMSAMPMAALAETKKILVMPFQIQAEKDYSFLKKGISQMLLSSLDVPGTSIALASDDMSDKKIDYTLYGTVLIFGNSVNTTAKLVNTTTNKTILKFNEFGKTKSDVLLHINLLAQQIRMDILHIDSRVMDRAVRLSDTGGQSASVVPPKTATPAVLKKEKPSLWRSRSFNKKFISLAVADTTGDSKNETIVATKKNVYVFLHDGKSFKKIAEFASRRNSRILSVDSADINQNNKAEIYVTSINEDSNRPDSFVMEWTGSGFTKILNRQHWLFRVIHKKTGKAILLGQVPLSGERMLDSKVSQLYWQGANLVSSPFELPSGIPLYSFAFGDIMNNGSEMLVVLNRKGRINIFDSDGHRVWESDKGFGGSDSYLEYKGALYTRDDGFQKSKFFIQQRIFVADLGKTGKNSVIVVRNSDASGGYLSQTRFFSRGYIEAMTWDNMGLSPTGGTRSFPGYISDYTIADENNDGKKELVFCMTNSAGMVDQKHRSRIYSQDRLSMRFREPY